MFRQSPSFTPSLSITLVFFFCLLLLAACSGGGGASVSSSGQVTGGIAVDPYIVGATFFEDINGNGRWDQGEQISSPSDEAGRFSFARPVPAGRTIVMLENGLHQGVPFTGRLMRRVTADDFGTVVVSPLTTYIALGLNSGSLASPLRDLNDSYTSDYDVDADPMAGLAAITAYDPADREMMVNLRANLYIGAALDLALLERELTELGAEDFQNKLTYWEALPDLIEGLRYAVSADALARIAAQMPAGISDLPPVTMREVAETMPALINWWKQELIRMAIEQRQVRVAAADLMDLVDQAQGTLGLHYYLRNHRNHPAVQREISARRLPASNEKHAMVKKDGSVGIIEQVSWQATLPGTAFSLGNGSQLRFFPGPRSDSGSSELTYRLDDGSTGRITGTWSVSGNLLVLADNQTETRIKIEMERDWSSHLTLRVKGDLPDNQPATSFVGRLLDEARNFQLAAS